MVRVVKKPEERKAEILETAEKLFLSKGYDKTTMRDVMKQLNIAKGTIYHYFKSKEELLEAVLDHIVYTEQQRLLQIIENTTGDAIQKIRTLAKASSTDTHDTQLLTDLHKPDNTGMHLKLLAKVVTQQAEIYGELVKQGCSEGLFSTDHPIECAEYFLSAIFFMTDTGVYPWTEEQLSRRIKALPQLVENQMRAPQGSFDFLLDLKYTPDH